MSISVNLGRIRMVDLAPGRVAFRERGTGEPIVFVHGVFTNGDLWRNVVPALATRYRCLTPDWPLGSHTTPMRRDADLSTPGLARLVVEFLSTLDLDERVTLVGNDTGGAICQLVIAEHPERIGRLVLTSCDAFELYPPSPFGFLRLIPTVPGAMLLLAQTQRIRGLRRLPLAYGRLMHQHPPRAVSDSYTRPGLRRQIRRDTKKVLRGMSRIHTLDAAACFSQFVNPTLIAWAEDDLLFPASLADRLAAAFPDARRITIGRARTLVAEDQPEQLATAIAGFIQKTPLAPSARARSGHHPNGEGDAWARPGVRATESAR
jgi:pimeloyl-ACP methyl ester carboxylesterase